MQLRFKEKRRNPSTTTPKKKTPPPPPNKFKKKKKEELFAFMFYDADYYRIIVNEYDYECRAVHD